MWLFICLGTCISIYLSIYPAISVYSYVAILIHSYLSIYLCIFIFIYLSQYIHIYQSTYFNATMSHFFSPYFLFTCTHTHFHLTISFSLTLIISWSKLLISSYIYITFWCTCKLSGFFQSKPFCELNYHDQKIRRTLTHDIRKQWTAVLTLLGLIISVYHDLHHWRSN